MRGKSCCFIGDRNIPRERAEILLRRLKKEIVHLVHQGVGQFSVTATPGFSMLAARAVLHVRRLHPGVSLTLFTPISANTRGWSEADRLQFEAVYNGADKVTLVSERYSRENKPKACRNMVDHSAFCVSFPAEKSEDVQYALDYAQRRNLHIIDLAGAMEEHHRL